MGSVLACGRWSRKSSGDGHGPAPAILGGQGHDGSDPLTTGDPSSPGSSTIFAGMQKQTKNLEDDKYDYIIVGGGTCACVLAYRLDCAGYKVLILERGPHCDEVNSKHDTTWPTSWNVNGTHEFVCDDGRLCLVGSCMGGGSTINVGITFEEEPSFYSQLGHTWWAHEDMENAISDLRHKCGYSDSRTPAGSASLSFAEGMRNVVPGLERSYDRCLKPNTVAQNISTFKEYPQCPGEYRRHSAAELWLESNAKAKHGTVVERVLFDSSDPPCAIGVEFLEVSVRGVSLKNPRRKKVLVAQGGEVILCSGTFSTPLILMRSGVGPEDHLRQIGVDVRVSLGEVGKNLIDRPTVPLMKTCELPPEERDHWAPVTIATDIGFCEISAGNTFEMMLTSLTFLPRFLRRRAWIRSSSRAVLRAFRGILQRPIDQSLVVACGISEVYSRGEVTLRSQSALDPPRIKSPWFSDPRDLRAMVETVRAARDGLLNASRNGSILASRNHLYWLLHWVPNTRLPQDSQLEKYCRKHVVHLYHHFSTCAAGRVVDETLAVHGVRGVRICDLSVVPTCTRGNPQQVAMTIAWRAADIFAATNSTVADA